MDVLNQLMSLSKLKDRLRQYKSLQNLYTIQQDSSVDRRCSKKAVNETSKPNKSKKKPPSRLVTEVNDKLGCSKEQLKKYAKILKNQPKHKKPESKLKDRHNPKPNPHTTSTKQLERNKISSPVISRFMPRKQITEIGSTIKVAKLEKRHLKTKKYQEKTQTKVDHAQSVFLEKETKHAAIPKTNKLASKDNKHTNKSKHKGKKINSDASLESTPSCMMAEQIELMDLVGEGTFGKVFKGRLKKTGQVIAVKRVLQDSRYKNRQIQIVRMLSNDFVMQVLGSYLTHESGQQYLNIMMKYYEENLFSRIKQNPPMTPLDTKMIIYQMFKGLSYLHSLNICHRDIKPENILLRGNAVAICDFGSAKILNNYQNNISYICARCYRAPQLIFGSTNYTTLIDIWSAGCVILQMLHGDPLFIGDTSITHLHEIMKVLGTPTLQEVVSMNSDYDIKDYRFPRIKKQNWIDVFPDTDRLLLDLIDQIMVYTPTGRVTAVEALSHPYFDEIRIQQTYCLMQTQYKLSNFFNFSEEELAKYKHLRSRVVPAWCD